MIKDTNEKILKRLVGIQLNAFKTKPVFEFDRWKAYSLPPIKEIEGHPLLRNFQVNGNEDEKIVVRTWLNHNLEIERIRYYYLTSTDPELAEYLVKILIQHIADKYPLANKTTCKDITTLTK